MTHPTSSDRTNTDTSYQGKFIEIPREAYIQPDLPIKTIVENNLSLFKKLFQKMTNSPQQDSAEEAPKYRH